MNTGRITMLDNYKAKQLQHTIKTYLADVARSLYIVPIEILEKAKFTRKHSLTQHKNKTPIKLDRLNKDIIKAILYISHAQHQQYLGSQKGYW